MHFPVPLKVYVSVIVNMHNIFNQPLTDVRLGCFQFYASINNVAVSICVHISLCSFLMLPWARDLKVKLLHQRMQTFRKI